MFIMFSGRYGQIDFAHVSIETNPRLADITARGAGGSIALNISQSDVMQGWSCCPYVPNRGGNSAF